jgi:hypothetical protein
MKKKRVFTVEQKMDILREAEIHRLITRTPIKLGI